MSEANVPTRTIRPARPDDVPRLAVLLETYMRATFNTPWNGSAEALARDAFGVGCRMLVAEADGVVVAFAAWRPVFDLHHCLHGVEVIDMYVEPAHRGRGVAPLVLAELASKALGEGASFLVGQAVEGPMRRLYDRFARCFPAAQCYLSGRAFRALAAAAGSSPRAFAKNLPRLEWNLEP